MVDMRTEGGDAAKAESYRYRCLTIGFKVNFFTSLSMSLCSCNLMPVVQSLFSSHNTPYTIPQRL